MGNAELRSSCLIARTVDRVKALKCDEVCRFITSSNLEQDGSIRSQIWLSIIGSQKFRRFTSGNQRTGVTTARAEPSDCGCKIWAR